MADSDLPKGLIIDLITPMKGNDIDGRSLGKLLDRVLPYVHAVFIASPYMGEGRTLNIKQRAELFDKTLVVIRGKLPVMAWISQSTIEETKQTLIQLREKLEARRYKGPVFWVDSPLYYHSNRGLPRYYEEILSLVKEPLILHNDPDLIGSLEKPLKRSNIRTSILKELAGIKGIEGLIFMGSLDRSYNYQKAVRSQPKFMIYDGDESHFLEHPSNSGVVSSGANLSPRAWQKITVSSLKQDGDSKNYPDYVRQIWDTWGYLNEMRAQYRDHGVLVIKQLLAEKGVIEDPSSNAGKENTGNEIKILKELMKSHGDF